MSSNNWPLISSEGSFTDEDITVKQVYKVPVNQLWDFASSMLPLPIVRGNTYQLGYKSLPGSGGMPIVAKSIRWEPFDPSKPVDPFNRRVSYAYGEFLRVEVDYSLLKEGDKKSQDSSNTDIRTLVEIQGRASGEYLAIPIDKGGKWTEVEKDEPTEITETISVNKPVPVVEWSVRWPDIPFSFASNLINKCLPLLGKVNSKTFSLLFNAFEDTILFLSLDYSEQKSVEISSNGTSKSVIKSTVEMHFLQKAFYDGGKLVTHQHIYRKGYGWRKPVFSGGRYLYDRADLNVLLS